MGGTISTPKRGRPSPCALCHGAHFCAQRRRAHSRGPQKPSRKHSLIYNYAVGCPMSRSASGQGRGDVEPERWPETTDEATGSCAHFAGTSNEKRGKGGKGRGRVCESMGHLRIAQSWITRLGRTKKFQASRYRPRGSLGAAAGPALGAHASFGSNEGNEGWICLSLCCLGQSRGSPVSWAEGASKLEDIGTGA